MRAASLFTGVGGLDLALGVEPVVQVEREPYCLDVLALRWPGVERITDVRDYHPAEGSLDLVFGGPPCQPVSHAGRRKGDADDRWLWPEALRVVAEARPATVFFENPMGIRTLGLDGILAELTGLGYGGAWEVVAAADVGAPHLRKRIFIMGVRGRTGWDGPTRPPSSRGVVWDAAHQEYVKDPATWPTPTSTMGERGGRGDLLGAVRGYPSPSGHLSDNLRGPQWPTPTASGERPNEGNVRLLRARVVAGDMTEAEAASMLNGKSPFAAQGKVPAMPTPTARLSGQRGPQAKRYFDPARSNDLDDYVAAYPAPLWPTPSAGDNRDRGNINMPAIVRRREKGKQLNLSMTVSTERGALSPDWVCWLMGLPIGWEDITRPEPGPLYGWEAEPAIPRVGLGIPNRAKRLTALGNAVCPPQGQFAYNRLKERLGVEE